MKEKVEVQLISCQDCRAIRYETPEETEKAGFYSYCPICKEHSPRIEVKRKAIILIEKKGGTV